MFHIRSQHGGRVKSRDHGVSGCCETVDGWDGYVVDGETSEKRSDVRRDGVLSNKRPSQGHAMRDVR